MKKNERIKALCHSESELISQLSRVQTDFLTFFESDFKSLPARGLKPEEKQSSIAQVLRDEPTEMDLGEPISHAYPGFGAFIDKLELFIDHQEVLPTKIIKMIEDLAFIMRMKDPEILIPGNSEKSFLSCAEADVHELWNDLEQFKKQFKEIRQELIQIKSHLNAGYN
jgi:hypothetical protein